MSSASRQQESFISDSSSSSDPSIHNSSGGPLDDEFNPLIPQDDEAKPLSMAELKMRYMRDSILASKEKYCRPRNISTTCVTWNVNGREPQESLVPMLPDVSPDIFVLGLQEIDRRPEAYMYNVSLREQVWIDVTLSAFSAKYPNEKFVKVASKVLVGLFIVVISREEHENFIGKISVASASCGIMGVVGNKGAVGIRFKIYNSYVCFVNCHLAAHPNQILRRNQDLSDLHKRLIFPAPRKSRKNRNEKFSDPYWHLKGFVGVDQCDVLFWLGDFNYRVEMENQLARIFVQHGQLDSLLEKDQMKLQRDLGQKELSRYMEAEITFSPSYSFDSGTDNYDSSEKQRVPSWCDRVMWRGEDRVKSNYYKCLYEFKSSDHKPVILGASLEINEIVPESYEACYVESLKQLDTFENAAIPDTEVSTHSIDAGVISYHQITTKSFKIINKGRVIAQFRFISHNETFPNWIKIHPNQGLIAPGKSEEVAISFIYDNSIARNGEKSMEHILILHIEGGRDHFICANFQCRETSFGKRIEDLKFHKVLLDRKEPKLLFKVPTVLWRLIDFLIDQNALETENLFLLSGDEELNSLIQSSLDLHEPFPVQLNCEIGYHSIAVIILRFFCALPDSLIPSISFERCIQAAKMSETTVQALNEIPEANFFIFEYLLRFIRDVLLSKNQSISHLAVAQVFGSVLMRPHKDHRTSKKELKGITQFMSNLIG